MILRFSKPLTELLPPPVCRRDAIRIPARKSATCSREPVLVEIDGKPAATLKAGQAFIIPAGAIHNATNKSSAGAKVLATYIIDKGKPVATPAK